MSICLTYLFLLPINKVPVISQFCPSSFPELKEYSGCRRDHESITLLIIFDVYTIAQLTAKRKRPCRSKQHIIVRYPG